MKFNTTKAFFVPLAAVLFLLSLSSCGKDYDLVSEYVVRDNTEKSISTSSLNTDLGVAAINLDKVKESN
ncbi:hypothetical protein CLV90_1209 [Maribacter spongiicola]|uniref:Uncharacterized protein n=1 Tax=Maribacter spongiicola TaxID=1206753 RepID=A0A4R7K9L3_9FLAO|nr:hypothetical protein [Maribacter spongiicola]TDT47138.1 hypothetical protein CLV90_1209 [Maribacter spongiicola]